MLPDDWQRRMADWVRGAEEPDPSWFAGGPYLAPRAQIDVYRQQYAWRLFDALVVEVPGLWALIGAEQGEPLLRAYLADHPSKTWTLNRVADALVGWMRARGCPEAHVDMTRLDHAVMCGFEAASGRTPRPEQLAAMPPLRLQPHVRVLRLGTDAHVFRSAVLAGQEPPPLTQGDFPLVVFRRGLKMRHALLEPGAWRILATLGEGGTVPGAFELLVADGADPSALVAKVPGWFRFFAERDLVEIDG